jgi:acyl carrier protein
VNELPDGPEVRAALAAIAGKLGHAGPLLAEQRLKEDLRLDSLGLLTLAVEVEDHFRVCLSAEDEAAIRTVGDLERVLRSKLDSGGLDPAAPTTGAGDTGWPGAPVA